MVIGDSKPERCITGPAQHVWISTLTYTTHLLTHSDAESEEVQTLLDRVNESDITAGGDTQQVYTPVDTTHMTLANSGLGARVGDETAVAMECESMSERKDGEQSMMAGGGTRQHTTGASIEMTLEALDIALTDEDAPIPPVTPHDTLADNGRSKVKDHTSTPGTPATAVTQPTPESVGCKRLTLDLP